IPKESGAYDLGDSFAELSVSFLDKGLAGLCRRPHRPVEVLFSADKTALLQGPQSRIGRHRAQLRIPSGGNSAPEIGREHVRTPVTNALLVCRLLLKQKKT